MRITKDLTDISILEEIGRRLESARLALDLTQTETAAKAGVSRATIERVESGDSIQLTSLVRILRALGFAERIELLVDAARPGPIDLLENRGKPRRRASGQRRGQKPAGSWVWGDEE